jgi:hypothetical protein
MSRDDFADDLLLNINDDNIEEFIKNAKSFGNWHQYLLTDEQEYFIHYAISK